MVKKEKDTEVIILDAARKVFTRKGLSGARMQEIADEAGINKALLHYYFRNKDQLFQAIFNDVFPRFLPVLFSVLNENNSFEEKLRNFVSHYIDEFRESTYIPVFLIHEIHQNPERLEQMASAVHNIKDSVFIKQFRQGVENGLYKHLDPAQLIANLISLSVFPIMSSPILRRVFEMDNDTFSDFLDKRKEEVPQLIMSSIQKK